MHFATSIFLDDYEKNSIEPNLSQDKSLKPIRPGHGEFPTRSLNPFLSTIIRFNYSAIFVSMSEYGGCLNMGDP